MKIFNWVHRKFHPSAIKDDENRVSMEVGLLDAAILTIGTFGLHPFKLQSCHQYAEEDYSYSSSSSGDNESQVKPLVKHNDEFDFDATSSPEKKEDDRHSATATATGGELIMSVDGVYLMPQIHDHNKMSGRGTTTLADLFLADSDRVQISNLNSVENIAHEKPIQVIKAAAQYIIDKKLVSQVGQKSHPINKLNRMMKRKIHPELCSNMDDKERDDTAYLLHVPAA